MSWVRDPLANDAGVTLVEIVIAVSLLGIIIGPITSSFLIGILESTSTRDRVADSSGAQILSVYLLSDIESSHAVDPSSTCLPASLAGGTTRLGITWTDPETTVLTRIAYVDLTNSHGQHELHRASCAGSTETTSLLVQDLDVNGFTPTCDGSLCTTELAGVADATDIVSVQVAMKSIDPSAASSYSALNIEIEAMRRVGQ